MTLKSFLAALAAVFAISVAQTASASSCGGGDHDHSHGEGHSVMDYVKTVSGSTLNVEKEYDEVMIGSARVVEVDIRASNGVIHVIDEVLLPKS